MLMRHITMGEATKAIQGYPTQVWTPVNPPLTARDSVALLHDPRMASAPTNGQPRHIYFIPGDRVGRLLEPRHEQYKVKIGGAVCDLLMPDAVLWRNHGGPCEANGADYQQITADLMDRAYELVQRENRPVTLAKHALRTSLDYWGPFDYELNPTDGRVKLQLMDLGLIWPGL